MIRRLSIAVCALIGAVVLTSCSQFDRNGVAASVDGTELSQDEMAAMLRSDLGINLLNDGPTENGFISGAGARGLLSAWIGLTAIDQAGLVASADRAEIDAQLAAQFTTTWSDAPQSMRDLAITNVAVGNAVSTGELEQEAVLGAFDGADIFVDSRYGAWDPESVSVVALG